MGVAITNYHVIINIYGREDDDDRSLLALKPQLTCLFGCSATAPDLYAALMCMPCVSIAYYHTHQLLQLHTHHASKVGPAQTQPTGLPPMVLQDMLICKC